MPCNTCMRDNRDTMLALLWMALLSFFLLSASATQIEGDVNPANTLPYSGAIFSGRQYPSEEQLPLIPITELVEFRPTKLRNNERKYFFYLFSLHPRVKPLKLSRLSRRDFVNQWMHIWNDARVDPNNTSKKMSFVIMDYLHNVLQVPQEIEDEVIMRTTYQRKYRSQQRRRQYRRTSDDPEAIFKRERDLVRQRKYHVQRRTEGTVEERHSRLFTALLESQGIDPSLPATVLEELTRSLQVNLRGTQNTTICFQHFLMQRNPHEEGIQVAIARRKAFNLAERRRRANDRYTKKRTSAASEVIGPELHSSDSLHRLISLSAWWT